MKNVSEEHKKKLENEIDVQVVLVKEIIPPEQEGDLYYDEMWERYQRLLRLANPSSSTVKVIFDNIVKIPMTATRECLRCKKSTVHTDEKGIRRDKCITDSKEFIMELFFNISRTTIHELTHICAPDAEEDEVDFVACIIYPEYYDEGTNVCCEWEDKSKEILIDGRKRLLTICIRNSMKEEREEFKKKLKAK